jgi:hypothetical protein
MLYRLYHQSGVFKNVFKVEAEKVLASGGWHDVTEYKSNQEKLRDNKSLFFSGSEKCGEPKHERHPQRCTESLSSEAISWSETKDGKNGRSTQPSNAKTEKVIGKKRNALNRKVLSDATDTTDSK